MGEDLDTLDAKIKALREKRAAGTSQKSLRKDASNNKAGVQAGMEFCFAIAFATFIGYKLDEWLDTSPLCLILLFFFGVATGFWSLYKFSLKIGRTQTDSRLHETEKTANKTPEKDS